MSSAPMPRWRRPEPWSWLLTVLFVASNAMWLLITLTLFFAASGSKESAADPRFATDLADAQPAVKYEQRVYSNTLIYNETAQRVERVTDPKETQYFGPPSLEMDEAWSELLHGTSNCSTLV